MQDQSESQKFDFLKKKKSGDVTVAHLNVEKLGALKRRELVKTIKSLDIDLLSIVEHHISMEDIENAAPTVKNCHSLLIPGYTVLSKHRSSSSGVLVGIVRKL